VDFFFFFFFLNFQKKKMEMEMDDDDSSLNSLAAVDAPGELFSQHVANLSPSSPSFGDMAGKYKGRFRQLGFGEPFLRPPLPSGKTFASMKCVDIVNNNIFTSPASWNLINGLLQGYQYYNRIANKIHMASLDFQLLIGPTANSTITTAGQQFEALRCMIVYDRQANVGTPADSDLLNTFNVSGTPFTSQSMLTNPFNTAARFLVLWDNGSVLGPEYKFNGTGYVSVGPLMDATHESFVVRGTLPLDLITKYDRSSTGTPSDITTGSLWFVAYSRGYATYKWNFTARLNYWDF
jgi:hypothetical protein